MSAGDRLTEALAGTGLRHALGLTAAFVTPGAFALAAVVANWGDGGTPQFVLAAATILAGVAACAMAGLEPSPGALTLLARGVALFAISLGIRALSSAPAEAGLLNGSFRATFVLLVLASLVGHTVAARVALFAAGASTKDADRAGEQALIGMWVAASAATIVLLGIAVSVTGAVGAVLGVAGPLASAVVLAHLRLQTPHPSGRRPAVIVVPPGIRPMAIGTAIAVTAAATVVAMALMPPAVSETSGRVLTWLGELDLSFSGPTPGSLQSDESPPPPPSEPGTGETGDPRQIDELPERVELGNPSWWLVGIVAGVLGIGVLALLRPDRWAGYLRRMLEWIRKRPDSAGVGQDSEVAAAEPHRVTVERGPGFFGAFERLRPRPRDPRRAILYDYQRADRALSKLDQGRRGQETPLEHAARLELGDEHLEFASLVSSARYGRAAPSPDLAERSRELGRLVSRAASRQDRVD